MPVCAVLSTATFWYSTKPASFLYFTCPVYSSTDYLLHMFLISTINDLSVKKRLEPFIRLKSSLLAERLVCQLFLSLSRVFRESFTQLTHGSASLWSSLWKCLCCSLSTRKYLASSRIWKSSRVWCIACVGVILIVCSRYITKDWSRKYYGICIPCYKGMCDSEFVSYLKYELCVDCFMVLVWWTIV